MAIDYISYNVATLNFPQHGEKSPNLYKYSFCCDFLIENNNHVI